MVGIVLGVSMAATKVRMVLVEGENADGVTVDQDDFDLDVGARRSGGPSTAPAQVISAILGTREGAAEGGYELLSTGVTWSDHVEAAMLRDALIAHKLENVMLVSAFMAAAALTQAVGDATNYARTALLFVEPYTATLAVVSTHDGSISGVRRRFLAENEDEAVAELVDMASGAAAFDVPPDGLVVIGSGVDIPLIKPALEAATSLPLSVPEEPETALARGAALASANAPLFASSTAALAYALDPATGAVDPLALAGQFPGILTGYLPEYRSVAESAPDAREAKENVAYSALPDDEADVPTALNPEQPTQRRKSLLLVGSALAVIFITAVVALEIALAISIRPTVALRPSPNENIIAPTQSKPVPSVQAKPKVQMPKPVAVPHPMKPPAKAPVPAPVPVPVLAPPVIVPAPHVPVARPPAPRLGGGRGRVGRPFVRGPFGGGRRGGPFVRGPFGGGRRGGPFVRGPFRGGRGFGGHGFGRGRDFGGHGFGGHGFGGHGFGGFGGGHGFGGFGHR